MADTTYYVDTDVSGGAGDGSSWANAYSSLNAAEAARNADITAVGIITFLCRGSTNADTTAVAIDGWTTDATHYVVVSVDSEDRHAGTWSDTKYRLATASNARTLFINENYTIVDGVQLSKNSYTNIGVIGVNAGTATVKSCILKVVGTEQFLFATSGGAGTVEVRNSILYASVRYGFYLNSSGTVNLNNVTVAGCPRHGVQRVAGTVNCNNVASIGNGDNSTYFCFSGTITKTNCASTDTTADGTNCETGIAHSTSTFVNVTAGSQDYHLVSGSGLIDQGSDLSGTFTTDIDGETRSGTWDIGADEYVAAGGASIPRSNPFSRPFSQSLGRGGF